VVIRRRNAGRRQAKHRRRHKKVAVRQQYRTGSYPDVIQRRNAGRRRRNTAGGKSAARHKKNAVRRKCRKAQKLPEAQKTAVRRQYRAGSYPDAVHPSSSRLRRDKAAERWSPKAKVPQGTEKPPSGGSIAPGRTRSPSGETPPEAKVPQGTKKP